MVVVAENKDIIIRGGALPALTGLLSSENVDVQCNACGCMTTLATSGITVYLPTHLNSFNGRLTIRLMYWRYASLHTLDYVLKGCISQYNILMYQEMHTSNTLIYLFVFLSNHLNSSNARLTIRLMYWRDASLHTLDYCIGGMHLSIQCDCDIKVCIPQYNILMYQEMHTSNTLI